MQAVVILELLESISMPVCAKKTNKETHKEILCHNHLNYFE